ncbi:hypothetical protein E2C01_012925 [Portunus trituberculatus]|uniref:Uncharacterized protein n=1 Tax=Portunus trituberculatus TaxID=210409 RepID=A0A5B7DFZ2_PORTR|nr:hypothetical protein [Portunus trituberculatus]
MKTNAAIFSVPPKEISDGFVLAFRRDGSPVTLHSMPHKHTLLHCAAGTIKPPRPPPCTRLKLPNPYRPGGDRKFRHNTPGEI